MRPDAAHGLIKKMKFYRTMMLALCMGAAALMSDATGASRAVWEDVTSPRPEVVQSLDESDADVAILVADGYIYLTTEKTVTIKIFSILGQLISQDTLRPGTHRIKLASRGIYILRAGSTTRRITL
mgnify:CR=1 FL=1